MKLDAMSAQDASFLFAETEGAPLHIAIVALFEGPVPAQDEIERWVSSKLDQIPRYRQRVRSIPLQLGQPVWLDDERFDLAYHLRRTALPSPGSVEGLETLVGRLVSQKLDLDKPLWELWVVEGLADGRWAIVSKTHHCLVDGVSGSDLMSTLLDSSADEPHPPASRWHPRPTPGSASLAVEAIANQWRKPFAGLGAIRNAASAPRRALRDLTTFVDGLASFRTQTDAHIESSLNGPIGPHRRWCTARSSLDELREIARAHGGTVNDIVLAAIAHGFRKLLEARGAELTDTHIRCAIPVSMRHASERGEFNNRVTLVFIELPLEVTEPLEVLGEIREQTEYLKAHHQADAADKLGSIANYTPPVLLALGARLFMELEQHAVQTIATNVPGPRQPLFAAGRRMLEAYPYVPIFGSIRIAIAIFSYSGGIGFGVTGDYESAPDIDALASGIESGIEQLLAASRVP